jgi:hypothetical protein
MQRPHFRFLLSEELNGFQFLGIGKIARLVFCEPQLGEGVGRGVGGGSFSIRWLAGGGRKQGIPAQIGNIVESHATGFRNSVFSCISGRISSELSLIWLE